ncbi:MULTISPECIES: HNH endonuclease signature motif containing protein [unclassified Arthrobacter]|uniref:HNH endonuclease n=1 Tax=unclassified Arthrobacter TaxID=235627 RepID=UPI002157AE51|nr:MULTISPECIES: HNH endonuclease signature motif containing protein [unclassified Arthrobacter]
MYEELSGREPQETVRISRNPDPDPSVAGPAASLVQHWTAVLAGMACSVLPDVSSPPKSSSLSGAAAGAAGFENPVPAATGAQEVLAAPAALAALIDQIRALEELKAAASAAQARATAVFDAITRRSQAAAGVLAEDLGKGVGAQIGFARRESPHRGNRLLGLARILTREMPHTLHALTTGVISEWRATLLVRETACLTREDRQRVDELVAGNLSALEQLGDRQLIARIKTLAYTLDPHSVVNRTAKATAERFVSCRPAPDTMTYVTALLPVAQGVGVYAALTREADRLRAAGDPRTKGQIMADTFVERTTGQARAEDVRIEVQLIMTDRALLAGSAEPAVLPGYGMIPAQTARNLVRGGPDTADTRWPAEPNTRPAAEPTMPGPDIQPDKTVHTWLRRLYTEPSTGQLVGMDSRARLVPSGLARFIAVRDQLCRMPWCGAPIRNFDHIRPFHEAGPTTAHNLQGLCEACNQAKEAPGWKSTVVTEPPIQPHAREPRTLQPHTVETRTPTGHVYRSTAPPLPGTTRWPGRSVSEPLSLPLSLVNKPVRLRKPVRLGFC